MSKSLFNIVFCLSMVLFATGQLSTVPKRFRMENERTIFVDEIDVKAKKSNAGNEFGRSSLRNGRQLEMDLSMSMPILPAEFEFSMSMSMSVPALETEAPTTSPTPSPTGSPVAQEPIGCNGDSYCPADMVCQCWLFCRFCFFPPCGTCVPN